MVPLRIFVHQAKSRYHLRHSTDRDVIGETGSSGENTTSNSRRSGALEHKYYHAPLPHVVMNDKTPSSFRGYLLFSPSDRENHERHASIRKKIERREFRLSPIFYVTR